MTMMTTKTQLPWAEGKCQSELNMGQKQSYPSSAQLDALVRQISLHAA